LPPEEWGMGDAEQALRASPSTAEEHQMESQEAGIGDGRPTSTGRALWRGCLIVSLYGYGD